MAIGFVAKANNLRQFLTDGVELTLTGYIRHKVPKRRVYLETNKVERGKPRE